jgi:hypothetical protein
MSPAPRIPTDHGSGQLWFRYFLSKCQGSKNQM